MRLATTCERLKTGGSKRRVARNDVRLETKRRPNKAEAKEGDWREAMAAAGNTTSGAVAAGAAAAVELSFRPKEKEPTDCL